ncbi:MAG TPA: DUF4397 domain-containing protein [Gemmatimonadaceae bacterium]|nr:DUF4397 domain-containing protein [Gemmatimonadaceae bacterium]
MNRHKAFAALLCAGVLMGCGDKSAQNITAPPPASARIRFFNFGVNAPSVNFYADETKMTATQSSTGTEATTGVSYGGVGSGGAYDAIAPGSHTFSGKIAATTDKDLAIANVTTNIEDGKYYSLYLSGIYNSTAKTSDAFVVEDDFTTPTDFSQATVRFVHAISNANPLTLYAKNTTSGTETAIGSEIAYKSAGSFVNIPAGTYDLSARYTGSSTNALARTSVPFSGGRVYTITARGDITVAPTSTGCASTNRTCLDNTTNR